VLKAAASAAGPDEIVDALQASGVPVTDPRNGQTTPRLSLLSAAQQLTNSGTAQPGDATPPTGSVRINSGAAATRSRDVKLLISGRDISGIAEMCVAPTAASPCTPWEPYATSKAWTLPDADGAQSVFVWLKDRAGNAMAAPVSATIALDRTPPSGASLAINAGAAWATSRAVTLAIGGSDPSGVQMCLSNTAGAECGGSYEAFATSKAWLLAAGADGPRAVFLYLRDGAGNAAAPVSATVTLDATPPGVSSFSINGGAPWTTSRAVSLAVAGSDASGVAAMCVKGADVPCATADYVPYANPMAWTLPDGPEGQRTVYVRLRDGRGNVMQAPATASIGFDASPPSRVSVTVVRDAPATGASTEGSGAVAADAWVTTPSLTLGIAATDVSGVEGMCLSEDAKAPCTAFVPYAPRAPWRVDGGPDGARTVYVTLRDARGNTMPAPASADFRVDLRPPADGRVVINDGAAVTRWRSVKLALSASDVSEVTTVCLTGDAGAGADDCRPWVKFAASRRFSLPSGRGAKTVRAFFKDANGHVTPEPAAAGITYDPDAPEMTKDSVALTAAPSGTDGITVTWSTAGLDDVAKYTLVYRPGNPPLRCRNPTDKRVQAVPASDLQLRAAGGGAAAAAAATVRGLKPGRRYGFRLCAEDAAGNLAKGVTTSAKTARAKRAAAQAP
jgi:hypothetical protein